jgi:hypothetical protein
VTLSAILRTWGLAGLRRRATYEAQRRFGLTERSERRWLERLQDARVTLSSVRPELPVVPSSDGVGATIALYGGLDVVPQWPSAWHVHPLTGRRFADAHWSSLAEGDASAGDIKDLWELGRLTWLGPLLRAGAAEDCWRHVRSFSEHNPPYRGPQWMCGQESALRGIVVGAVASRLRDDRATTTADLVAAARLMAVTVGRVRPTIRYALSQRNNHAISEAAFLWTATYLVDGLPDAGAVRAEGARALREAIDDQWYPDGAYAQHSPTYQRLAMHALLWVMAVARAAEVAPPYGVAEAVQRSHRFLTSLLEPTTGAVPNLGGNDGALLFDIDPAPRADFRPVLAHAVAELAALGRPVLGPEPAAGGVGHHVHRGPASHAVLRAGPMRHRPAHADQLHVDLWIGAVNVACDPGSYRYTAPAPWSNALADEAVHNVIRVPGQPQAVRRGRFLWTDWIEATVVPGDITTAELVLASGARLRRELTRTGDEYAVSDSSTDLGAVVRWNLPAGASLDLGDGSTSASGPGWAAEFRHRGRASVLTPADHDPRSGWRSPTYGVREPLTAIELQVDEAGTAEARFWPTS